MNYWNFVTSYVHGVHAITFLLLLTLLLDDSSKYSYILLRVVIISYDNINTGACGIK